MAALFSSSFSEDAAFKSCKTNPPVAPGNAELTARFVTATSTSYEGGSSTSSTKPSSSSKTTSTATADVKLPSAATPTLTMTPTTQKITSTLLSTLVTSGPLGPSTVVNTVRVVSVHVSTPDSTVEENEQEEGEALQSGTNAPITKTFISTSFSSFITDGPVGPTTMIDTVQVISVVVSTPNSDDKTYTGTPAGPSGKSNNAARMNLWPALMSTLR